MCIKVFKFENNKNNLYYYIKTCKTQTKNVWSDYFENVNIVSVLQNKIHKIISDLIAKNYKFYEVNQK